ncbi:MAG: thioredoxin [Sediminibacterium sp.]|jgi:thioredoxin 1|nr:thioredoxin [Sediminibacterium sp.]
MHMLNNTFSKIINSEKPVLVDFYADWCGPCRLMPPVLKEIKEKMGDQVQVFKVNVDEHADVSAHFQVSSIPTLMIFKKGQLLWREPGVKNAAQLHKLLQQYIV